MSLLVNVLQSLVTLVSGVPSEIVHDVEGSQILTNNNALLHRQDAVEDTQKQTMLHLALYTCVCMREIASLTLGNVQFKRFYNF